MYSQMFPPRTASQLLDTQFLFHQLNSKFLEVAEHNRQEHGQYKVLKDH